MLWRKIRDGHEKGNERKRQKEESRWRMPLTLGFEELITPWQETHRWVQPGRTVGLNLGPGGPQLGTETA